MPLRLLSARTLTTLLAGWRWLGVDLFGEGIDRAWLGGLGWLGNTDDLGQARKLEYASALLGHRFFDFFRHRVKHSGNILLRQPGGG